MSHQPNLFGDSIYESLEATVQALGGNKVVGYELRPEMGPEKAGQWLRDALNPKRREALLPHDMIDILKLAQRAGVHSTMWHICGECEYEQPKPVNRQQQVAELQKDFMRAVSQLNDITAMLKAKGVQLEAVK